MIAFLIVLLVFFIKVPNVLAANVVLNEIMAYPASNEDEWVEIYNLADQPIDLSGWKITDNNSTPSDDISLDGQITSLGFRVFSNSKSWLNNSGDTIYLKNNQDLVVDSYTFGKASQNKTFGKQPDGVGSFKADLTPTQNTTNGIQSSATETPSPTISPSPAPSDSGNSTVSGVPSSIDATQSFNTQVALNLSNYPNTIFFLKGAFFRSSKNYFGFTKVGETWVKNSSKFSDQFQITTDSAGNWSGNIEVKPDEDDSGFEGSGDYKFKVARYTQSGSGPTWSNEVNIHINQILILSSSPTPNPSYSASPANSNLPLMKNSPTPITKNKTENFKESLVSFKESSVAGVSLANNEQSSSSKADTTNKEGFKLSYLLFGSGFLVIALGIIFIAVTIKKNKSL